MRYAMVGINLGHKRVKLSSLFQSLYSDWETLSSNLFTLYCCLAEPLIQHIMVLPQYSHSSKLASFTKYHRLSPFHKTLSKHCTKRELDRLSTHPELYTGYDLTSSSFNAAIASFFHSTDDNENTNNDLMDDILTIKEAHQYSSSDHSVTAFPNFSLIQYTVPIHTADLRHALPSLLDSDVGIFLFDASRTNTRNQFDNVHYVVAMRCCLCTPLHWKAVQCRCKKDG
eukprot:9228242-Ditylum_brightwellii.AAC.1